MTLTTGPGRDRGRVGGETAGGVPSADSVRTDDTPRRCDGVQLIGELAGSGYREPPSLVRRADGQTIQLTPLLYLLLAQVDGRRTFADVAEAMTRTLGRPVTEANVRSLVDDRLRPAGLLLAADGSQPELRRSDPLLALRFKYAVTDPERTRRITAPFAALFHPVVVGAVLLVFAAVAWWVLFEKGLASATHEAFDRPGLLMLVFAVTVLSAGFHEFGHAAAARRGGATPGAMGAGIYLVWPAFYTDVTDSYRLGRAGRVRTDLGGLYFNAIVAVAVTGVWWTTGYDALLLVVATQILQMVRQLTPLVRFDGYHVLADLTGVPDLFARIRPTLLGLLPWRWHHPETTALRPWARAVVTAWVVAVVPLLALTLVVVVVALPRLLGSAWAGAGQQAGLLADAWGELDLLEVAGRALALVALVFPVVAVGYVLVRLVRRTAAATWRRTRGKPVRRAAAALVAMALVAGLAYAWWPRPGSYRPVQPWEGGTLTDLAASAPRPSAALRAGHYGTLTTAWPEDSARPTAEEPQLALVLVPRAADDRRPGSGPVSGASSPDEQQGADATPGSQAWVFPFDKPLAPDPGDNQALAVNTTDGTVTYDVAFALVWVSDDSPALNSNEAYAFASCTGCAAVSVAFQVVLVTGDNHVAAPRNISAAVNYDCVGCLTYALATQLFVTVDGPLSETEMAELDAIWEQVAAFGTRITEVPLADVRDRLTDFEQQILAVVTGREGGGGATGTAGAPTSSPSATGSASPSPTTSDDATPVSGTGGSDTEGDLGPDPEQQADTEQQAGTDAGPAPTQAGTTAPDTDESAGPSAGPAASSTPTAGSDDADEEPGAAASGSGG